MVRRIAALAPIREAAFASLKGPLRPVPVPVDPTDGSEEREASDRRRILQYGSHGPPMLLFTRPIRIATHRRLDKTVALCQL